MVTRKHISTILDACRIAESTKLSRKGLQLALAAIRMKRNGVPESEIHERVKALTSKHLPL